MTISFEIPPAIEQQLRTEGTDLNREAKEVYLVERYRQHKIPHRQLGEMLGLEPYETDGLLKRHNVGPGISQEQMRAEAESLRDVRLE